MTSPEWAFWYSYNIIEGRWPEAETIINSDSEWASLYKKGSFRHKPEA